MKQSGSLPALLFPTPFAEAIARQEECGLLLSKQDMAVLCILARLPANAQIEDPVSIAFFHIFQRCYVSHIEPWVGAYLRHEETEANLKHPPSENLDLFNFDVDWIALPTSASSRWSMIIALLDYKGLDTLFEFEEWSLTGYKFLT
jgi:hypothetical protein